MIPLSAACRPHNHNVPGPSTAQQVTCSLPQPPARAPLSPICPSAPQISLTRGFISHPHIRMKRWFLFVMHLITPWGFSPEKHPRTDSAGGHSSALHMVGNTESITGGTHFTFKELMMRQKLSVVLAALIAPCSVGHRGTQRNPCSGKVLGADGCWICQSPTTEGVVTNVPICHQLPAADPNSKAFGQTEV